MAERFHRFAATAILGGALAALAGCAGGDSSARVRNGDAYAAWRAHRSHVEVTIGGSVARDLGTRTGPSGDHHGFLVHLDGADGNGLTLRVEDNVDLTGPVPIAEGRPVEVRGEYLYDPRGGVVHRTHRDPRGRRPAGYVLVDGKLYQ